MKDKQNRDWITEQDWIEYDYAAQYMARKGMRGDYGDPLPPNMRLGAWTLINDDIEAFRRRVQQFAYERAMQQAAARHEVRE